MMNTQILPERMKDLPVFKGLPVPFTTFIVNGTPDFKVTNMEHWYACTTKKLCAICGQSLEYWVWWIGGPSSTENGVYFDPAMHESCARFAAMVCPFLAKTREYAETVKDYGAAIQMETIPMQPADLSFLSKSRRDAFRVNLATKQIFRGAMVHSEEIPIVGHR